MTNEELAQAIQQGEQLFPQLWEQTRLFIFQAANSYFRRLEARCTASGVTVEDLCQEGYLALVDAVTAYDGEYKLLTWLKYPLLNHFNALVGYRQRNMAPLNRAQSLDAELPGTEGFTIADTIPDPMAAEAFLDAEEALFIADLRRDLERVIDTLTPARAEAVRGTFFEGLTLAQLAAKSTVGPEQIRQRRAQGLRDLRKYHCRQWLMGYREHILEGIYKGSLSGFKHSHTSSTERAALKLYEADQRFDAFMAELGD